MVRVAPGPDLFAWLGNFGVVGPTFFRPNHVAGSETLLTLRDAAQYIIRLPKAERELPEWETAIEWLMLPVPRGKIIGRRVGAQPTDETDRFLNFTDGCVQF